MTANHELNEDWIDPSQVPPTVQRSLEEFAEASIELRRGSNPVPIFAIGVFLTIGATLDRPEAGTFLSGILGIGLMLALFGGFGTWEKWRSRRARASAANELLRAGYRVEEHNGYYRLFKAA